MDFFGAQDAARSRSRKLVLLFGAAVLAIIVTVYAVVHVAIGPGPQGAIDPGLLLIVALGTSLVVMAGSAFRTLQMRQGGAKVAEMLGGRQVRPNTTDEDERRLVNVVEEMAIAAGTPVPAIFVLDQEEGINAFAAGYTLDDAAIAVTHGTLVQLNRDELQGVIAHEFSHVLNGDMRLNIRLIGLLFGILLLAVVGRTLLYSGSRGGRGRRDNQGGQIALVGLALIVVGYIGVFFGKLIQAAVSRQREYLADAAAVQFTRNPDGIAGALKKIGAAGSRIRNPHAQEASHLFFATGLKSSIVGLLATHPELPERIRRIDPAFDGNFPELEGVGEARLTSGGRGTLADGLAAGLAGDSGVPYAGPRSADANDEMSGAALLASIGTPQPEHVAYASRLLASLPEPVRRAAHDPDEAVALLMALLLHEDGPAAARQRQALQEHGGSAMSPRVAELSSALAPLGPAVRLPVLDLLLPALRAGDRSPDQSRRVYATAEAMVAADGRMDMFELALLHVLGRQLVMGERGRDAPGASDSVHSFEPLRREVETVLSALTWSGARNEGEATPAFSAGISALPSLAGTLTLRPRGAVTIEEVDDALGRLRNAAPRMRGRLLEACVHIVAHDGSIDREEAELLRAVAEALDIPVPPMLITTAQTH